MTFRWQALLRQSTAVTLVALAFLLAFSVPAVFAMEGGEKWVGTWSTAVVGRPQTPPPAVPMPPPFMASRCPVTAAPALPPQAGQTVAPLPYIHFANQTLRQIVHTSLGGSQVRVVLSNAHGTAPLVIGGATVAVREKGSNIQPASVRALRFSGRPTISIPARAVAYSDVVELRFQPMADLAIDLYLPGSTDTPSPVTMHNVALQTNYVSATGNHAGRTSLPTVATTESWFFLARVEVLAPPATPVVVAFGDSLTDGGARATPDANNRWLDQLLRRTLALPAARQLAFSNAGIGGNRVLGDGTFASGFNALARFDADVLAQPGATHVVIQAGLNDIGGARQNPTPTAEDIIVGYKQLIERARSRGLKVIGATMTPFWGAAYYSDVGEAKRQAINAWIRASGAYDAVLDFDLTTRDPIDPRKLRAEFDSCDHLHPSDAGYRAMADAVDLAVFEP